MLLNSCILRVVQLIIALQIMKKKSCFYLHKKKKLADQKIATIIQRLYLKIDQFFRDADKHKHQPNLKLDQQLHQQHLVCPFLCPQILLPELLLKPLEHRANQRQLVDHNQYLRHLVPFHFHLCLFLVRIFYKKQL